MSFDDQWIEIDHLGMIMEGIEDGFAGDASWKWRDGRNTAAFRHGNDMIESERLVEFEQEGWMRARRQLTQGK